MEIVGIAAPIRDELFDREAGPAIYEPSGRNYRGNMFVHVRAAQAGTEADLLTTIRRELRAYDPRLPHRCRRRRCRRSTIAASSCGRCAPADACS